VINVFEPEFTEEDKRAVTEVLDSGWLNEHDKTKQFEETFARYVKTKYAVACNSGTTALFMALKASGVGTDNRVAVPAYTAMGTIRAVQLTGAWAILVDIDDEGLIDVEEAKKANASHVIAVHNNGYPCNMEALNDYFGEDYVIEDACQCIGSHPPPTFRHLGTIAKVGCFSLATTKIITSGQGGVVVTDDEKTYTYLQRLKNQGNFRGVDEPDTYHALGFNFKWTEMEAALALSQLKRLPDRIMKMRKVVGEYYSHEVFPIPPIGVLPWRIIYRAPESSRDKIIKKMRAKGINVQPLPKPIDHHVGNGTFKNADKYASQGIYLPSSFTLNSQQIEYICDTLKEALYG